MRPETASIAIFVARDRPQIAPLVEFEGRLGHAAAVLSLGARLSLFDD